MGKLAQVCKFFEVVPEYCRIGFTLVFCGHLINYRLHLGNEQCCTDGGRLRGDTSVDVGLGTGRYNEM
jgi:hypothetical protein